MGDKYRKNPKHGDPFQPGARGTLCPPSVDGTELFAISVLHPANPTQRFATDGERAYTARADNFFDANDDQTWHGYPCNWRQIPTAIQRLWIEQGLIARLRLRG